MKQSLARVGALSAAIALLGAFAAGVVWAVPALPNGDVVFEFNSWEFLSNRNPRDPNGPGYNLQVGDVLSGVVKLDNITDGSNTLYNPDANGTEITGYFSGVVVTKVTPVDLNGNGIPDLLSQTWDTTNAFLDIWFDDSPDFDEYSTRAAAVANAQNGTKLIKLQPKVLETLVNTGDTFAVTDDVTDTDAWLDLFPGANDFLWNNLPYTWTMKFEKPGGSGIFYPFKMQQDIYAPGSTIYGDNASLNDASGAPLWDYYNTDDVRGELNNVIPEPATMTLMGSGLLGLAAVARSRRKKA